MAGAKTLLLVEDEPLVRSMIQEVLFDIGFTVCAAESGSSAIELIDTLGCTINGVITDVRLGKGPDGWAVARHVRERCPGLPVIYVTGDSAHEWSVEGVPESQLVQKPFVVAQITKAVAQLIH